MSRRIDWHVAAILLAALGLRLLVWWTLPYRDTISDEAEYWNAAVWLAQGRGFSFFDGWIWTRPPLYLIFLAIHARMFGPTGLWSARLTQAVLSVVLVWLVMRLARRLAPAGAERRVALIAGWAMALSYSFASFAFFLLSETVFLVLFVAALLLLIRWAVDRRSIWLVGAGVLLGLAALTKAIVLTWLPLVALWVLWYGRQDHESTIDRRSSIVRGLGAVALLTIAVCAVVLPWSAYATLRWGGGDGIILVDTTGGYNFALGAQTGVQGGRNENALHDTLCGGVQCSIEINSHAARQADAYALGWTWIAKSPSGFVAKTGRELLDMIQLQYGGAERLRAGYTLGEVPLSHLIGLLSDDTLYVGAVLPAIVGLWRRQNRSGKGLIVSWLLYNIVVGALVFAINRFRQPLLPFLFIYAACAVAQWRSAWHSQRARIGAWSIAAILAALILPTYVYWPPILGNSRSVWQDTLLGVEGLRNAAECRRIENTLRGGEVAQARSLHDAMDQRIRQRARYPNGLPCLALINARLLVAEGRIDGPDGALQFLAQSAPINLPMYRARILMLEGDLYRRIRQNQQAIERFVPRDVDIVNDLSWAWQNLDPPATDRIDLGGGLDIGYIDGFYTRAADDPKRPLETGYRWSGPHARLRFPDAGTGQPQTLTLRINGYTQVPNARVTPSIAGQALPPFALSGQPGWTEITIDLPPTPRGEDVLIDLASPVFLPGPDQLAVNMRSQVSQPLRMLGVQLDWAELKAGQ